MEIIYLRPNQFQAVSANVCGEIVALQDAQYVSFECRTCGKTHRDIGTLFRCYEKKRKAVSITRLGKAGQTQRKRARRTRSSGKGI